MKPVALLCLSLAFPPGGLQEKGITPRLEDPWRTQYMAIHAEIAELGPHPWAGSYHVGLLFENWSLWIAPRSGFVFTFGSCTDNRQNRGTVREENGALRLSFLDANPSSDPRDTFSGFPATLFPVSWGERRYMSSDLLAFCNYANSGVPGCYGLFLREGDHAKPVEGRPRVPASHARYLLERPLQARVVSARELAPPGKFDPAERRVRLDLDLGSSAGAFAGMWLFTPATRDASPERYEIVELGEHASVAEGKSGPKPGVGVVLSTFLRSR